MTVLPAVVFAILAVSTVIPLNQVVAVPKPEFDWTQFLKGVKRASVANDVSVPDAEEVDIDYQDSQFQIKPIISNPMSPFLSMKPFLPVKPTFIPPLVDPQFFINKKTALLNGLFSPVDLPSGKDAGFSSIGGPAMAPNYFAGKKTAFLSTLFNHLATSAPQTATTLNVTKINDMNGIQRRLIAPWLATSSPVVDPKVMTDKKAAFLNKLFSSLNTATAEQDEAIDTTTVRPDFWMPLAVQPPVAFQPTVKPTIVPPDFWLPFGASQVGTTPVKYAPPIVDPSLFIDKKTKFLNDLMSSLTPTAPTATNPGTISKASPPTIVPPEFWAPIKTDSMATYDEKVSEFLDKLFTALTTPTGTTFKRSVMDEGYGSFLTRSVMPSAQPQPTDATDTLFNAKDKVTNTIIGELIGIKNNMLDTLMQMLKSQKAATGAASLLGSKPGKKAGPPFGGLWSPMSKLIPPPDPTIQFQQKIDVLNQVFDMLTDLQKDLTLTINEAAMPTTASTPVKNDTNTTILDLLKKKLMDMDDSKVGSQQQVTPQVNMYGIPLKYNVRDVNAVADLSPQETGSRATKTRGIKMAVHQGYQSLPPGTTEMLQAGGGSTPQGKEGGGIKLQKGSMNDLYNWKSHHHHHQ